MKRSDLFREYARVIDLCEGTNINSLSCVKLGGNKCILESLSFTDPIENYTFALAIVEDNPVFAGDVLYHIHIGCQIIAHSINIDSFGHKWISNGSGIEIDIDLLTWTKTYPFADILQAQAEGKRIVFYDGSKWVDTDVIDTVNFKPESYKVVEYDNNLVIKHISPFSPQKTVSINWNKCGITGKISAEVIE